MLRFIVIRHVNQKERIPFHHLLREYHWESIDAEHVLLMGDVPPRHLDVLESHPDVLVVPSLLSDKTVHAHAQTKERHKHFLSLRKLGIDETHRPVHVSQKALERYGYKFSCEL